jgi:hypothetical protein
VRPYIKYFSIALASLLLAVSFIRPAAAQSVEETCRQHPHRSCIAIIAFDTTRLLTHPFHQSGALSFLAPAVARLGQQKNALELAAATPISALKAVAFARIAEVLNDDAVFDQAALIFESLSTNEDKNLARQGIAEALARSGRIDRAVSMAEGMPSGGPKLRAYSVIAAYDPNDKYLGQVLGQLRADKPLLKATGLSRIAGQRKDSTLAEEAVLAARVAKDKADVAHALAVVAYNLNDSIMMAEAVAMAKSLPAGTRLIVAEMQGSLGEIPPALDVILPVPDLNIRAYILSNIAFNMR